MANETSAHSFPSIPDSRPGKALLGLGILASSLAINSLRGRVRTSELKPTNSSSPIAQKGDLIEGSSFLEVGENGIQFQGPDPRLSEARTIPIFDCLELQLTETG